MKEPQSAEPKDVTTLLLEWRRGDVDALGRLVPLVHRELRQIARRQLAREGAEVTLQPTGLVNEAYVRLVDLRDMRWQDRAHFFAMSARVMRRVLVDIARARRSQKRGEGAKDVTLEEELLAAAPQRTDVLALNDALNALSAIDPRKGQVVEMRFFGGLTVEETATALDVSRDTVLRDWKMAKAWLLRELRR